MENSRPAEFYFSFPGRLMPVKSKCPPVSREAPGSRQALPLLVCPRRISLVEQTVEAVRQLIAARQWTSELPGEEALRKQFGISRVTLRKSLAHLAAHGVIKPGGRGRRHLITGITHTPFAANTSGGVIKCLSAYGEMELVHSTRIILDEIRKSLAVQGVRMDWEQQAKLWKGNPARQLEQLAADPGTAGWFLYRATPEIQQWFRDSRLPSVVLGPCHAGITLPSVQADVAALGRHMAAESARLGHRHLAFVVFDPGVASSLNTLEGLRRITLTNGQPGRISVVSDDGTTAGLRSSWCATSKPRSPRPALAQSALSN